jgi:hypothetical protein
MTGEMLLMKQELTHSKSQELSKEIQLQLPLFPPDLTISDGISSLLTELSLGLQLEDGVRIVDLKQLESVTIILSPSSQSEQSNPEDQVIRWSRALFP